MALLPPHYLNSVVALGGPSSEGMVEYNATGFVYGLLSGVKDEEGNKGYALYLVTNRHVYQRASARQPVMHVRFNKPMGTGANLYEIPFRERDGNSSWSVHPNESVDVAVIRLNPDKLGEDGIEFSFFASDSSTFTLDQARETELCEGDGVFVLGFPLGEAGDERNYTIVRQGIVARAQDWLNGYGQTFLIDASIFPGNSGGPILLKPEAISIRGTQSNDRCGLLGMVSSYLPYREVAVSTQTERPRMIFEENSGLGVAVPHDLIKETVELDFNRPQQGRLESDVGG